MDNGGSTVHTIFVRMSQRQQNGVQSNTVLLKTMLTAASQRREAPCVIMLPLTLTSEARGSATNNHLSSHQVGARGSLAGVVNPLTFQQDHRLAPRYVTVESN
jgi:hypothetical protein